MSNLSSCVCCSVSAVANEFPSSFESIVRKILRLLYHVVAHIYHCHFREVALLGLHVHLNCVFAHLTLLNQRFNLIDSKETEILGDLEAALLGNVYTHIPYIDFLLIWNNVLNKKKKRERNVFVRMRKSDVDKHEFFVLRAGDSTASGTSQTSSSASTSATAGPSGSEAPTTTSGT